MTDTVDLVVVGVEDDIPRAKMSDKLVQAFKQESYSFEALLDGAYGESAPYAAQSDVERGLAEEGMQQLTSLGLKCAIVPTGEIPEVEVAAPIARPPAAETDADASAEVDFDDDNVEDSSALASFKAADGNEEVAASDVEFETDGSDSSDGALAAFKKDDSDGKSDDSAEVDFSAEIDSVGGDSASSGLADAKDAKNDVAAKDDALNHDFTDQLEEVGSDELSSGLKEGQQAKPDFDADVKSVDFSDDASLIGIHENAEEVQARKEKQDKLEEAATERDLASFPKEGVSDIDFSDDLDFLSSGETPTGQIEEQSIEQPSGDLQSEDAAAADSDTTSVESKSDVPKALAGSSAGDLDAELIDPAPAEKKNKEPVVVDDGGLSLSSDDSAPLTAPKEKSDSDAADDGGLSLSGDSSAPLTAPKEKANPEAADDGGLSMSDDSSAPLTKPKAKANPDAGDDGGLSLDKSAVQSPAEVTNETTADNAPSADAEEDYASAKETAQAAVDDQSVDTAEPAGVVSESAPAPEPAEKIAETRIEEPAAAKKQESDADKKVEAKAPTEASGLVLPGQITSSVVPNITPEEELSDTETTATQSLSEELPTATFESVESEGEANAADVVNDAIEKAKGGSSSKKKLVAAVAGVAVLAGAGTFAFMNAGSIIPATEKFETEVVKFDPVKGASRSVEKVKVEVADLAPGADLESLSTGELLVNLSDTENSNGILDLEPYFLESGDPTRRGPRIGAAVPAESEWMVGVENRVPHPADKYFDDWSNREADLSLFLALLDNLIEKGELDVAQQLSDRAKDKLFAVMSSQRLARAYSDVGENEEVSRLMSLASRDTFAIKAPEERVLAISDYALTEQAIGLNEDAMDTFLKTTILARSLVKPETRTVGLSSAAIYFQSSGRTKQAQQLLDESMKAGLELPRNTAARDLAIRYIALSEARMGLFNQALKNAKTIVDPFATVSAYHGIALAIESTGDDTNARKVLNMAYRAGSLIEDKDERSKLLSKVVLASETD